VRTNNVVFEDGLPAVSASTAFASIAVR